MSTIVKMPQLGESVVEGTVARWLKTPGDVVAKLEPLLEISTDKIDTEVPAPADGILLEILVAEGQTVRAGTTLAYIGVPGERAAIEQTFMPSAPVTTKTNRGADLDNADRSFTEEQSALAESAPLFSHQADIAKRASRAPDTPNPLEKPIGRAFISPVVGRMAAEHNIDLEQVTGTGAQGRITKKDLEIYLDQQSRVTTPSATRHLPPAPSPDEILQPLTAMRRAIAQHMVQSVQTSPHVTTVFEVDMTAVVRHREQHKAAYVDKGIKLTFTPYFVAAAARALKKTPEVNSRFSEAGIVQSRRIHIGVAVALEQGLIVPVVRDADEKNLQGLARAVNELAERARNGNLAPDAVKGGTFTITNHGVSGSLIGTPIINQPQAAILGIGTIVKRPVVRSSNSSLLPSADDALVIRPMCYLSLSFDHRLLDGAQVDGFLTIIKEQLENWPNERE